MKICPTCGSQLQDPRQPKRICSCCGKVIGRNHKWQFGPDGRPVHRNCGDPESYGKEREKINPKGYNVRFEATTKDLQFPLEYTVPGIDAELEK